MNDEKLDLSVLDPARNGEAWAQRVRTVASRALAAQRWTVTRQLESWTRPVLWLASAATLCCWIGVGQARLGGGTPAHTEVTASSEEVPAFVLSRWAGTSATPSAKSLLLVLGEPE